MKWRLSIQKPHLVQHRALFHFLLTLLRTGNKITGTPSEIRECVFMGNTETDHVKVAQSDEKTGKTAAAKIVFTLAEADLGDVQGKVAARGSGAFYPSTHQERLQEFVDGFGRIGKAYNDAVHPDEGR